MKRSTRVCALCDTVIPDTHVVCRAHFQDYTLHKEEPWFKVLVDSARRQFEIDNEEIAIELGDMAKESKRYKKLTESVIKDILMYREKGLGPGSISKLTGVNVPLIKYYLYKAGKL